jgi:hypothetical protein
MSDDPTAPTETTCAWPPQPPQTSGKMLTTTPSR